MRINNAVGITPQQHLDKAGGKLYKAISTIPYLHDRSGIWLAATVKWGIQSSHRKFRLNPRTAIEEWDQLGVAEKIEGLLTKFNDAVTSVLKVLIRALLANTDLFIKYTTGMESVDRSAALKALQSLLEDLGKQPASSAVQAVIWTKADVTERERDVPWEDFLSSVPSD